MQHITGISRHQLCFSSLEDTISADNPVRFIDAFVGVLDLTKLGFISKSLKSEGRPSYHIQVFLKIYLYGYLDGIKSSRKLSKEAHINLTFNPSKNEVFSRRKSFVNEKSAMRRDRCYQK